MLKGANTAERMWNFLREKGLPEVACAGVLGNAEKESGLKSTNLQNSFEKKLGMTDESYTAQTDSGQYTNFVRDSAGYGLFQWTYWSRKQNMLNYMKAKGKSIGDEETQMEFFWYELNQSYPTILKKLMAATTVLEASNIMLLEYEKPANQGAEVQKARADCSQKHYDSFASKKGSVVTMGYTNSPLVDCTVLSPNHSGQRTHALDRITPHCVVGQLSAERIGGCFPAGREASCNYGIGLDGRVCLIVEEKNRSWCSSNSANDQRAITIEVASDSTAPYAFKDAAYNKLVDLCADICKRNGKSKLLWMADKNTALNYSPKADEMLLTVHRWFANKSCPGDWMYNRMGDLAEKVTAKLGGKVTTPASPAPTPQPSSPAQPSASKLPYSVKVDIPDLNIRKGAGTNFDTNGVTGKGVFTIVAESAGKGSKKGWGKLKSGAGWISLDYAKKI